jgi:hypothetical protein
MKTWQKVVAGLLVLAAIGWVLELTGLAPKQPAAVKAKPTGAMYMGGMVAIDLANSGGVKPSGDRVNALARQAASKNGVADPDERSKFVRDFEFGFWKGWETATR